MARPTQGSSGDEASEPLHRVGTIGRRSQAVIDNLLAARNKMDEPHANDGVFANDGAHAEHSTPADIFLAEVSYTRRTS